jgi:D-3-phosphoglycerate dehydrogenase
MLGWAHEHPRARRLSAYDPHARCVLEGRRASGDDLARSHQGRGVLAERLRDAEAICLLRERTPIRAALIERLDRLRIISQIGVYPHIDVEACTRRGVVVAASQMPGRPSYATAELNWGLILAAFRRIPQEMALLRAGAWQGSSIGVSVRGKTLGGYGSIGGVVAGYGKTFGMTVLVWGRETTLDTARAAGHTIASSKEALFAESDVLVYEEEPVLGATHPLLAMDNVVCTPHLGYVERDGLEEMFSAIFEQVVAYRAGAPINVVNPDALAAAARR